MRIAYIGQKGIPTIYGGVERHVEELAVRMANLGYEVFVYTRPYYTPRKLKKFKKVNLISIRSIKTKHLDAITHTFFATIHALFSHYDIIHYHGVGPSLLSLLPRIFKPQSKVVVTFHCLDRKHGKWGVLAKKVLSFGEWTACFFPHQTIAVSKNIQKYCWKYYHQSVCYIPNGIVVNKERIKSDLIKKKFHLEPKEYFLIVSRLIPHKNIEEAIKIFLTFKKYKLVIVGGGSFTDKYEKFLKALAGNNKNIIFTGTQTGEILKQFYQNALAFVLPSKNEGLSISVLEALSYQLPVVVKNIADHEELINAGVVTSYNQSNDLREKVRKIIRSPQANERAGYIGQQYLKKNYSWNKIIKETNSLYNDLIYSGRYCQLEEEMSQEIN